MRCICAIYTEERTFTVMKMNTVSMIDDNGHDPLCVGCLHNVARGSAFMRLCECISRQKFQQHVLDLHSFGYGAHLIRRHIGHLRTASSQSRHSISHLESKLSISPCFESGTYGLTPHMAAVRRIVWTRHETLKRQCFTCSIAIFIMSGFMLANSIMGHWMDGHGWVKGWLADTSRGRQHKRVCNCFWLKLLVTRSTVKPALHPSSKFKG